MPAILYGLERSIHPRGSISPKSALDQQPFLPRHRQEGLLSGVKENRSAARARARTIRLPVDKTARRRRTMAGAWRMW